MSTTPNERSEISPDRFPPPHPGLGPHAGELAGLPEEARVYVPKSSRRLDKYFGGIMTLVIVLISFLVLVALLTNISPNSSSNLIQGSNGPDNGARMGTGEETQQGIVGD